MKRSLTLMLITAGLLRSECGRAAVTVSTLAQPLVLYSSGIDFDAHFYPLDLDADGLVDFTIGYDFSFQGLESQRANRLIILTTPLPDLGGPVAALPAGFNINSSALPVGYDILSSDVLGGYVDPGENYFSTLIQCLDIGCTTRGFNGQRGYVGVEFQAQDGIHYGYVEMEVPHDTPTVILYGWAYETQPNVPIIAGAIPEPGRTVLLLLGGLASLCRRRRAAVKHGASGG